MLTGLPPVLTRFFDRFPYLTGSPLPSIGGLVFFADAVALPGEIRAWRTRHRGFARTLRSSVAIELAVLLGLASAAGALMMLRIPGLDALTLASYTVFDVALALVLVGIVITILCQAADSKRFCHEPQK
jgi:hypothetical protein